MNQTERCHSVKDVPDLFIDAFKVFKHKTKHSECSFILTHYHGDHYNGLQRDNLYKGPALIHCTPITGSLLVDIHGVDKKFIVVHHYGDTWYHHYQESNDIQTGKSSSRAEITFFDANHCPGAAIIFIRLPNGTCHLHTGDMRFHEKMKSYPLIKEAASRRKIDLLYLDTTYGHPKHQFVPQDIAIDKIASEVEELLKKNNSTETSKSAGLSHSQTNQTANTLVLLSCYSIGKEKVLWDASVRSMQPVYVNEKKMKMLQCIERNKNTEVSSGIINRCTAEPESSSLHVISMGTAGEFWPYFRPNYNACAKYAQTLNKNYQKVVAFIPSGWADASNWNRKCAISRRRIEVDKNGEAIPKGQDCPQKRSFDIEIRLIAYSEHSSYAELCSFVEFLKPRKVIPTVFTDERDAITIEGRFKNLIDSQRAKLAFVNSIAAISPKVIKSTCHRSPATKAENIIKDKVSHLPSILQKPEVDDVISASEVNMRPKQNIQKKARYSNENDSNIATLVSMGFDYSYASKTLHECNDRIDVAVDKLLQSDFHLEQRKSDENAPKNRADTIVHYFSHKKNKPS